MIEKDRESEALKSKKVGKGAIHTGAEAFTAEN
jgi:hypothetical protein